MNISEKREWQLSEEGNSGENPDVRGGSHADLPGWTNAGAGFEYGPNGGGNHY